MCKELKGKNNFKYHKKGYMAMELSLNGILEIAPGVKGKDTFLWDKKEVVSFSPEEKMKVINFISKNERKFTDGDKIEPLQHMQSTRPKTIFISVQIYNGKHQLQIYIKPKDEKAGLRMSLDWSQVIGFKMWFEESLKRDLVGRRGDMIEGYAILSGVGEKKIKTTRWFPKELQQNDLYMWDEVTVTKCMGRLYDPYTTNWTYCFEFQKKKGSKNKPTDDMVLELKTLLAKNKINISDFTSNYGKQFIEDMSQKDVLEQIEALK